MRRRICSAAEAGERSVALGERGADDDDQVPVLGDNRHCKQPNALAAVGRASDQHRPDAGSAECRIRENDAGSGSTRRVVDLPLRGKHLCEARS